MFVHYDPAEALINSIKNWAVRALRDYKSDSPEYKILDEHVFIWSSDIVFNPKWQGGSSFDRYKMLRQQVQKLQRCSRLKADHQSELLSIDDMLCFSMKPFQDAINAKPHNQISHPFPPEPRPLVPNQKPAKFEPKHFTFQAADIPSRCAPQKETQACPLILPPRDQRFTTPRKMWREKCVVAEAEVKNVSVEFEQYEKARTIARQMLVWLSQIAGYQAHPIIQLFLLDLGEFVKLGDVAKATPGGFDELEKLYGELLTAFKRKDVASSVRGVGSIASFQRHFDEVLENAKGECGIKRGVYVCSS